MDKLKIYKKDATRQAFFVEVKRLSLCLPTKKVHQKHKAWVMKLRATVSCVDECVEKCFSGSWDNWFKQEGTFSPGGKKNWSCKTCKDRNKEKEKT